jgi:hypothetical protein
VTGAEAGPCRSSVAVPWRRRRADDVPARLARFTDEFFGVIKELHDHGKLRASNLHSPIARSAAHRPPVRSQAGAPPRATRWALFRRASCGG